MRFSPILISFVTPFIAYKFYMSTEISFIDGFSIRLTSHNRIYVQKGQDIAAQRHWAFLNTHASKALWNSEFGTVDFDNHHAPAGVTAPVLAKVGAILKRQMDARAAAALAAKAEYVADDDEVYHGFETDGQRELREAGGRLRLDPCFAN